MSTGSWRRWRRLPGLAREILGAFDLVLAQDDHQAERLRGLGAAGAATVGDLKAASTLPEADPVERARLRHALGTRPVWLAASTHPGEETLVIEAHRALAPSFPDLLTVLAPRHPARADAVAAEIHGAGLTLARRSLAEVPEPTTAIFLVDTLGELSLFYRLAPITLIGGSLAAPGTVGGHNPFEPAQAGAALIHGPDMTNCAAAAAALDKAGAVIAVADGRSLIEALRQLLGEPERVHRMGVAARSIAEAEAGVADRVMDRLLPLLDGVCDAGA
jgi:3-deoxy-D-manno-octulosonic-acid transferase